MVTCRRAVLLSAKRTANVIHNSILVEKLEQTKGRQGPESLEVYIRLLREIV